MQVGSGTDRYRTAAFGARAFVKSHLFFGASNGLKFYKDAAHLGMFSPALAVGWLDVGLASHVQLQVGVWLESRREGRAAQAAGHPYAKGTRRMKKALMEIFAKEALRFHCGNCGAQSALAFVRLRDYWKVFPLDWVQVKNGDHGFVVIGRDAHTDPSNMATWNDDAIVCDPWRDVVLAVKAYAAAYAKTLELIYRQESASDVPKD